MFQQDNQQDGWNLANSIDQGGNSRTVSSLATLLSSSMCLRGMGIEQVSGFVADNSDPQRKHH